MKKEAIILFLCLICTLGNAQTQVHYTGKTLSDPTRHDGGLTPVIGVHCIQTMRANREHPDSAHNVMPWTYNHQPMITQWQGKFWMHYLSDPVSEHVPPSQTFLQTSDDGYHWTAPRTLFPKTPQAPRKGGCPGGAYSQDISPYGGLGGDSLWKSSVMHQRVGWYTSSKSTGSRLLALGYYGLCPTPKDDPNDGNGIGRVVREIYKDGTFGPIYFLYKNHDFKGKELRWPLYNKSKDKQFRKACEEILNDPLMWMQMVEECDRNDEHLPLKNVYKAFCHYTLPDDSTIVGLWKNALTSQSTDGGRTWSQPVQRAKGFVNSNAKIWGQRLSDGSYATVYNPSEYRWPLAVSTSTDGINYTTLNLVHGEMTPLRYGGNYKSHGPQYVRGLENVMQQTIRYIFSKRVRPSCRECSESSMWVAYSMNKEDMWVAKIPVPIKMKATEHANDDFMDSTTLDKWNIISLVWAPVNVEDGKLCLKDKDPFDFSKAERIIPATRKLECDMNVTPMQNDHGELILELLDDHGNACTRLTFQNDKQLTVKVGARYNTIMKEYQAGKSYALKLQCDLDARMVTIWIKGKKYGPKMLFAPIDSITRISLRTGKRPIEPTIDSPADTAPGDDLPDAGKIDSLAVYYINNVRTRDISDVTEGAVLSWDDFKHYAEYFNEMEPEGVVQAIPNSESEEWMHRNIPFFECPDNQIEEMYYFRWWSYRKAIQKTPIGYVINEFLVPRSYADKYNMIACALGHHIMEGRWLRDTTYINDDVRIWLRGNDMKDSTKILPSPLGINTKPMWRLDTFSSWLPWAMYQRSLQLGNLKWMSQYRLDLKDDIMRWEKTNSYVDPSTDSGQVSLFWQRDVKDGMEEQISGARKLNNRRPTINSYMYGNYMAMALLDNSVEPYTARTDTDSSSGYKGIKNSPLGGWGVKALALKKKIDENLWNEKLHFYGTLTTADTLANVREEIGYLPWYFNMPDDDGTKYLPAWRQLYDTKGFDAPFGITTAERRHPLFRKRFKASHPSCEWDGAVWPFATSQTLTALANIENDYPHLAAAINKDTLPDGTTGRNLFFYHLKKYTQSQYRYGRPYIGEYLDETNGQWLMGDRERSKNYNHSTYCDLIITGLVGLRPTMDDQITVNPLIPDFWDYFCLDNLPYHGKLLTILYDKKGDHYHQGKGIKIIVRDY